MRTTYPLRLASRHNAVAAGGSGYDGDEGLNSDEGPRLSSLKERAGGVRDLVQQPVGSIPDQYHRALRQNPSSFLLLIRVPEQV